MSLPKICEALSNQYIEQSMINFASEYVNAYELLLDGRIVLEDSEKTLLIKVAEAADNLYKDEVDVDQIIETLFATRKQSMDAVEALTLYTDYFKLHEHLLSRVKYKYQENREVDNDEEARKILQFIFESQDNMEVNLRIKEMLGELPIRMLTDRFFDHVKDSVTVYKGAEKNSLDSFLYMLRSAAGIQEIKNADAFAGLEASKKEFDSVDYKEMDELTYTKLSAKLEEISDYISDRTELYVTIQKLINNIYTYFIVLPYGESNGIIENVKPCVSFITDNILSKDLNGALGELSDEILDETFTALEGRPEKLLNKIASSEAAFEGAKDEIIAVDGQAYEDLLIATKLMSTSDFVSFDGVDVTPTTPEMIDEAAAVIISQLKACFEAKGKTYRRAIMAAILKELPVFFVSHTEVMNYVRNTLDACKDLAEKNAALDGFWGTYQGE